MPGELTKRLHEDFKAKGKAARERPITIELADGGEPLTLYALPLNLDMHETIRKSPPVERLATEVVLRACDFDGNRHWSTLDIPDLMRLVDPTVINSILRQMNAGATTPEGAEGNSEATSSPGISSS